MIAFVGIAARWTFGRARVGDVVDRLRAFVQCTVEVDIAAVTFGGAGLANVLVQVRNVVPDDATVVAHGAGSPHARDL
jgi:hypothetical protein